MTNRHANKLWANGLEIEKDDIVCKMKGGTSAVCWRDKREVYLLTSMDFRIHITSLPRVALEDVMYILLEEVPLGHIACVKIVMQGLVSTDASDCTIQTYTTECYSE
jgi:hypothetical protein